MNLSCRFSVIIVDISLVSQYKELGVNGGKKKNMFVLFGGISKSYHSKSDHLQVSQFILQYSIWSPNN